LGRNVHAAKRLGRQCDQRGCRGGLRDVAGQIAHVRAGRVDLRCRFAQLCLVAAANHHACASLHETRSDFFADA
jgi:hypothetical protein